MTTQVPLGDDLAFEILTSRDWRSVIHGHAGRLRARARKAVPGDLAPHMTLLLHRRVNDALVHREALERGETPPLVGSVVLESLFGLPVTVSSSVVTAVAMGLHHDSLCRTCYGIREAEGVDQVWPGFAVLEQGGLSDVPVLRYPDGTRQPLPWRPRARFRSRDT